MNVSVEQGSAQALIERGIARYVSGELPASEADFVAALKLEPDNSHARACLDWVRRLQKDEALAQVDVGAEKAAASSDWKLTPLTPARSGLTRPGMPSLRQTRSEDGARTDPSLSAFGELPVAPSSSVTDALSFETPGNPPADPSLLGSIEDVVSESARTGTFVRTARPSHGSGEWHRVPTAPNLMPLDVPELDEAALEGLVSIDTGVIRDRKLPLSAMPELHLPGDEPLVIEAETEDHLEPLRHVAIEFEEPPGTDPFMRGPGQEVQKGEFLAEQHRTASYTAQAIREALEERDLARGVALTGDLFRLAGGAEEVHHRAHRPLLDSLFTAVLGPLSGIPHHGRLYAELDPRSAFLLSRIDGVLSIEDLIDISGMPRLEALKVLCGLVLRGAVVLE